MSIQFSVSVAEIIICLIASGLGAFAWWAANKANWPGFVSFWVGLFVALVVFAVLKG
jgi:hypothetical protein